MKTTSLLSTILAALVLAAPVLAQQDFSEVEIETIPVSDGIYMLMGGSGGNIGLSVGDDGNFLVDDQYGPLSEKILAAVAEQSDAPIEFVVNTHWHPDHAEGNENMGAMGAVLVAHENVRERMSTTQFIQAFGMEVPPSPAGALPVITFDDGVTLHWNGDEIRIFHVAPAHTDGDAVIHFVNADVIHTGDIYFNGLYPFIDVGTGGRFDGMIAATDAILEIAGENTKIIPGHGPLSDRAQLQAYRDMLVTVRDRISEMVEKGMDRDAVVAAAPTSDLDAAWGGGFLEPDMWVGIAYDALTADSH
ncbi:MAG: MBL fold metallo-hydrolase [Bacteroidetes bacterium]|nr:MBL fold metallo-hydrolase [Bacteroidota bacterium]